jgi:predicted nucleic acid-binding protein
VSNPWIVNASPVITLAKVGHLHLLEALSSELLVPEIDIPDTILEWGLGAGETSVLALTRQTRSATAVLDDSAARQCAGTLGIPFMGTLGVVVRAKVHGLLPSVAEVAHHLRACGLFLDQRTLQKVLEGIGEV